MTQWFMTRFWCLSAYFALGLSIACCVSLRDESMGPRVAAWNDALVATVKPLSKLSKEGCVERQDAELALVRAGKQTADQAEKNIKPIRERCETLHDLFERIRLLQNAAAKAYNENKLQEALDRIEEARELFGTVNDLAGGDS